MAINLEETIRDAWDAQGALLAGPMRRLLRESIAIPSVSGDERAFVEFIADWARAQGFDVDCREADEALLRGDPRLKMAHLPLAGRPLLLARLDGAAEGGRSLLFNAHSDVVAEGEAAAWRHGAWSGADDGGRIHGRGAADDKGPLIAALWSMAALRRLAPRGLAGAVALELVPGEEDCVGLGSLASAARGAGADGVIVLEPTEGLPCRASRAGCRFAVECRGRAVHGTVKWLGADAIALMREALAALEAIEARWNDREADPLFARYPIARPITVDTVYGGSWQGMVCDFCRCEGYLELLPGDAPEPWKARLADELRAALGGALARSGGELGMTFGEEYPGHATPAGEPFCRLAAEVAGAEPEGFNAGCEAGVRAALTRNARMNAKGEDRLRLRLRLRETSTSTGTGTSTSTGTGTSTSTGTNTDTDAHTPTLVWGPGSLAQAHAPDESIEFAEVERVAAMLTTFAMRWAGHQGGTTQHAIFNHEATGARRRGQP